MRVKYFVVGVIPALVMAAVPFAVTLNSQTNPPVTAVASLEAAGPLATDAPALTAFASFDTIVPPELAAIASLDTAGSPSVIAIEPKAILDNRKELAPAITRDMPGERIDFSSRRLVNNMWGAPRTENLDSTVFLNGDIFGWSWNRQDPRVRSPLSLVDPIYPSVRIGGTPWQKSNHARFPIKLGDIKSLTFELAYDYGTIPTGSYDLAYDMFLTETDQPGSTPRIKAEVMVWIHSGGRGQPPTTYKRDVSEGDNTYALYSWVMADGREYYSFILEGKPVCQAHHTVNAKRLIDNLALDPAWYVPGVELGNEVWNGSGKIEISQFQVTINGAEQ